MKRFLAVFLALLMVFSLAACNVGNQGAEPTSAPTEQPTADPAEKTEKPTAEPTEAPTEVPTPEPTEAKNEVDEHEYQLLRDFFEQKDAEGVTNGAKCFPHYDPDDITTWYDGSYAYDNYVGWNDNGHVKVLNIRGKGETSIVLCGRLALSELSELESVFTWNAVFEEIDASDLPAAAAGLDGRVSISTVSGDAVITGGYLDGIYLCSSTHVLCDMTGEADTILSELPSFKIDITVENGGFAGVNAYTDENGYVVKLAVVPVDDKVFVGWYDKDGNLFSGYEYIELFGEESGESPYGANAEFVLVARFESV